MTTDALEQCIKLYHEVNFNDVMIKLYGISKTDSDAGQISFETVPYLDPEVFVSNDFYDKFGTNECTITNEPKNCWDHDPDKRPTIQEIVDTLTPMVSQQIIQNLKLNHGLFLNGHKIEPSKRAVLFEDD
ncbi:8355_t:CDS:2 [Rhizophagus irregularis]|nr:8355_t:CDS:2 [Rhizophagus irregularis]